MESAQPTPRGVLPDRDFYLEKIEQLHARINRLNQLIETCCTFLDVTSFQILFDRIVEKVSQLVDAERSTLFIFDRSDNVLLSLVAQGLETGLLNVPAGVGIAGNVAISGISCNVRNAYADPRFEKSFDLKTGFHTRSILCAPIKNEVEEVIGVLQALNKRDAPHFSALDEFILEEFAFFTGAALERARFDPGRGSA